MFCNSIITPSIPIQQMYHIHLNQIFRLVQCIVNNPSLTMGFEDFVALLAMSYHLPARIIDSELGVSFSFWAAVLIGDKVQQNGEIFCLSVHLSIRPSIHPSPAEPKGQPGRPQSQASRPQKRLARPPSQPAMP